MKRHFSIFAFALLTALSGLAKTFNIDISSARPAVSNEAYYHGETIEFRAIRSGAAVTNIEFSCIYYQTNGMGQAWWKTDALVFHPTNDVGAAAYRFFLEGRDDIGRDWHANGLLRLLDSPGFEPNVLDLPVATLDFAELEILNAPWPAEIAAAAQAATNYTDNATNALAEALRENSSNLVEMVELRATKQRLGAPQLTTNDVWQCWDGTILHYAPEISGESEFWLSYYWVGTNTAASVWEYPDATDITLSYYIDKQSGAGGWYCEVMYISGEHAGMYAAYPVIVDGQPDGVIPGVLAATPSGADATAIDFGESYPEDGISVHLPIIRHSNAEVVYSDTLAAAVADAAPADYASVSNAAMSAVQIEADPTVPDWAKAATKPSYTPNEIFSSAANWIGVQGNAGRLVKLLAQTIGGVIMGGYQVTGSSLNDNNTTTYAYGGVAVKRDGVNQDYLWDATSTNGIVRRQELNGYKPQQTAKNSPTASGSTYQFIDTVSQDTNGVITATKKSVRTASTSQTGIVQLSTSTNSTSTTLAATPSAVKAVRDEIDNYVPATRTVAGKALSSDVMLGTLTAGGVTYNGSANATITASTLGAASASDLNTVSNRVSFLETWSVGDGLALQVDEATTSNATLSLLYTNEVVYSSAQEIANATNAVLSSALRGSTDYTDAAIASDAWGDRTSSGAPAPADALIIEKPKVSITGGGNFSYIEADVGGYYVMSVSLGSNWTISSLADAQNPNNPSTVTWRDAEGHAVYTITSTATREVYAVDGEQLISVATVGANHVVTITYPVEADSPPTLLYNPVVNAGLENYTTYENWPAYISSVTYSGQSGAWVATVTMNGRPGRGFFRAKYNKAGVVYMNFSQPIGFSNIVIGGTNYAAHVETIDGKKHIILED